MKLTKQQEKEVLMVIDAYWNNYIKGDVKAMIPLLDENYTQVGSAESEVFDKKKDAVKFLHRTIKEVAGKLQLRNRITKVEALNDFILIHDKCDLYALNKKEWMFYSKFRASSFLQKKKGGWKIVHQHSSFPDSKTEEGGNIAIENIAAENQQLREAVKRRTAELESKNKELQIEAALERVRARTMAMQKSEELYDVAHLLHEQFKSLGETTLQMTIGIANESEKLFDTSVTDWSGKGEPVFTKYKVPFTEPSLFKEIYKGWKTKAPSVIIQLKGERLKKWVAYRNKLSGVKVSAAKPYTIRE